MIEDPISVALNKDTFVPVNIGSIRAPGKPTAIYTEDGSAFLIATNKEGDKAVTVPADTSPDWGRIVADDGIIFYAKATKGTPNLVIFIEPGDHTKTG